VVPYTEIEGLPFFDDKVRDGAGVVAESLIGFQSLKDPPTFIFPVARAMGERFYPRTP